MRWSMSLVRQTGKGVGYLYHEAVLEQIQALKRNKIAFLAPRSKTAHAAISRINNEIPGTGNVPVIYVLTKKNHLQMITQFTDLYEFHKGTCSI